MTVKKFCFTKPIQVSKTVHATLVTHIQNTDSIIKKIADRAIREKIQREELNPTTIDKKMPKEIIGEERTVIQIDVTTHNLMIGHIKKHYNTQIYGYLVRFTDNAITEKINGSN
jgi:hypothetical protein